MTKQTELDWVYFKMIWAATISSAALWGSVLFCVTQSLGVGIAMGAVLRAWVKVRPKTSRCSVGPGV